MHHWQLGTYRSRSTVFSSTIRHASIFSHALFAVGIVLALNVLAWAGPISIPQSELGPYATHLTPVCAPPSFLDPVTLTCRSCPENSVFTGRSAWMPCECAPGYYAENAFIDAGATNGEGAAAGSTTQHTHIAASWTLKCLACAANEVSWRDRSGCTVCDTTTGATYDAATKDCTCGNDRSLRLSEFDEIGARRTNGKACVACPAGAAVELTNPQGFATDIYTCQLCPDARMKRDPATFECSCSEATDQLISNVPITLAPTPLTMLSGLGDAASSTTSTGATTWASTAPMSTGAGASSLAFPMSSPFESSAFVRRPISTSTPPTSITSVPTLAQAYHSLWPTTSVCVPSTLVSAFLAVHPISAATAYSINIHKVASSDESSTTTASIRNAVLETHLLPAGLRCRAAVEAFVASYSQGPAVAASSTDPAAATGTGTVRFLPNPLDVTACETLANLCVLTHYDQSHSACTIYNELLSQVQALAKPLVNVRADSAPSTDPGTAVQSPGFTHHFQDWPLALPWLLYSDSEAAVGSENIQLQMALASSSVGVGSDAPASLAAVSTVGSKSTGLRFVLVSRALNGTLVAVEELTNQLIRHCASVTGAGLRAMSVAHGISVGSSQEIECEVSLTDIMSSLNLPAVASTGSVVAGGGSTSDSTTPGADVKAAAANRFNFKPTYFYELFLLDSKSKWYPVPVKITTFRTASGAFPNDFSSDVTSSTRLVRRFMLVDNLAGLPSTPLSPASSPSPLSHIRWPSRMYFHTSLRGSGSHIYPPLLVIDYAARSTSDIFTLVPSASAMVVNAPYPLARALRSVRSSSGISNDGLMALGDDSERENSAELELMVTSLDAPLGFPTIVLGSGATTAMEITSTFSKSLGDAKTAAIVLFALGMVLALFLWILNLTSWAKAARPDAVSFSHILRAIAMAARVLGEICFWLCFIFAAYIFVFFKGQSSVAVILPTPGSFFPKQLENFVYIAFACQLYALLVTLIDQLTIDSIFIDWETVSPTIGAHRGGKAVSAWRRIFVANKWVEMQTVRGTSLPLNILLTVVLLVGLGLEGYTTAQPNASDLSLTSAPRDSILQFFMGAVVFLGFAGIQRAFKFLIVNRFLPTPALQFVDLLSATNISLCIIDHKNHMFYLHGKSVHSHVDAPLEELHRQIQRERRSWVQTRGLVGGHSCFSVFLTPQFRFHYDAEYYAVLHQHVRAWGRAVQGLSGMPPSSPDARSAGAIGQAGPALQGMELQAWNRSGGPVSPTTEADVTGLVSDELIRAHDNLNRFLVDFFERNLVFHRWELYERTTLQEIFDLPPTVIRAAENTSSVCVDSREEFTRTILLGIEHQLVMFYVATFCAASLWFNNNFVIAAFVVLIFDRLIVWTRKRWGKINIATKSMIDQRYLV